MTWSVTGLDARRSPLDWARSQWRSCTHPPAQVVADPGARSSHFANTGTGRCDYYRVAVLAWRAEPIHGVGAGNFAGIYVRERRTAEEPRVAHSIPLQLLGELGIVGAGLGAVVLGAGIWSAVRFARSGRRRDPAIAAAIVAIAYWAAHGSIDWLWQLPAVTLPIVALLGGLLACISPPQQRVPPLAAAPMATGVVLAIAAMILPQIAADRALRLARDPGVRASDRAAALRAARDAARLDPTWAQPHLTIGALLHAAGRNRAAARAGRDAVEREPRSWEVQRDASGLLALADPAAARRALAAARELNPRLAAAAAVARRPPRARQRAKPRSRPAAQRR